MYNTVGADGKMDFIYFIKEFVSTFPMKIYLIIVGVPLVCFCFGVLFGFVLSLGRATRYWEALVVLCGRVHDFYDLFEYIDHYMELGDYLEAREGVRMGLASKGNWNQLVIKYCGSGVEIEEELGS